MWCCLFPIYITGIKFLIWMHYWSCFRHSDKSGYLSLYIQFYKLLWFWFYADFFFNLGFYYKSLLYSIYCTTASPKEPRSVTSGLRVAVQPANRLYLSGSCVNSYQTFMSFLQKRCSRLFVLLFLIEYLISRSWLCLRSMYSVYSENREHLSDIKLF